MILFLMCNIMVVCKRKSIIIVLFSFDEILGFVRIRFSKYYLKQYEVEVFFYYRAASRYTLINESRKYLLYATASFSWKKIFIHPPYTENFKLTIDLQNVISSTKRGQKILQKIPEPTKSVLSPMSVKKSISNFRGVITRDKEQRRVREGSVFSK